MLIFKNHIWYLSMISEIDVNRYYFLMNQMHCLICTAMKLMLQSNDGKCWLSYHSGYCVRRKRDTNGEL